MTRFHGMCFRQVATLGLEDHASRPDATGLRSVGSPAAWALPARDEKRALPFAPFVLVGMMTLLAGCATSVPRLHQPDRIDQFCGDRAAIATAIESIVSSTGGTAEPVPALSRTHILKTVKDSGGIIAHWNAQALYLPALAKTVGADGDYVLLGDAAIGNDAAGADSRRIYLTLKTKTGLRTFALRAYDVQDVCNEGKLKS